MSQSQAVEDSPATPYTSQIMRIDPAWIDFNGHLNMAYYNVLFDACVDEAFTAFGMGQAYLEAQHCSTFTVEAHVSYLREVTLDNEVEIDLRILDIDEKRLHFFQIMRLAGEDAEMATSENMVVHVDMTKRKVAPFPEAILTNLDRIWRAHAALPNDPRIGHVIGIRRKPPGR